MNSDVLKTTIEVLKKLRLSLHEKSDAEVIRQIDDVLELLEQCKKDAYKMRVTPKVLIDLLGAVLAKLPAIQELIRMIID